MNKQLKSNINSVNYYRAIFAGAIFWLMVFSTFSILSFIPGIKDSLNQQSIIVGILIIPFAVFGAWIYYRKKNGGIGLLIGVIMAFTALVLDALVTVPFVEMPMGRSYFSFYSYPGLWIFVIVNVITVYLYWRVRIRKFG